MSTDIMIRIYPMESTWDAKQTFCSLVKSISNWKPIDKFWSDFKISRGLGFDTVVRTEGPLSKDQIVNAASKCQPFKGRSFHTSIPFQCWRHTRGNLHQGHAILSVHCWDRGLYPERENSIDQGYASISINPANPFWVTLKPETVPGGEEYNDKVEDNLYELSELLILIVTALSPRSLKVFVDAGWDLPFNSHCTYFADANAVIDDLHAIDRAWKLGLPGYPPTPPLSIYDERKQEFALSSLRSKEQRSSYWNELNQRLPELPKVTSRSVETVRNISAHEIHNLNGGFFVSDQPHFLNSFVDQFYVEVLDVAAQGN